MKASQNTDKGSNKSHLCEYPLEHPKEDLKESLKKHTNKSQHKSSDEALETLAIQQTLRGNKHAFSTIIERYTPLLYSLAFRMLGNNEEAEEAVQEILLKVYRSLGKFLLSRRFHPWLYTIALNWLRSHLRRRGRRRRHEPLRFEDLGSREDIRGREKDPAEQLEEREAERVAQKAIMGLRREYREVFILRHIEGLSTDEVAQILKLPEGTVKTYLYRARQELIKTLTEEGWGEI
ncbi:MAG: RNA polymerase sigma factor [Spirochaetota bacterium]